jgi:hypothetical protein
MKRRRRWQDRRRGLGIADEGRALGIGEEGRGNA